MPLIKSSIICIDQFHLILRKVSKDYYGIMNGKMQINEMIYISKELVRVSSSLYQYISMHTNHNRLKECDRFDRIKK